MYILHRYRNVTFRNFRSTISPQGYIHQVLASILGKDHLMHLQGVGAHILPRKHHLPPAHVAGVQPMHGEAILAVAHLGCQSVGHAQMSQQLVVLHVGFADIAEDAADLGQAVRRQTGGRLWLVWFGYLRGGGTGQAGGCFPQMVVLVLLQAEVVLDHVDLQLPQIQQHNTAKIQ